MQNQLATMKSWTRRHFVGVALLVILLLGSGKAVEVWKKNHPGAMSVIEAQAMDMTAMKPTVGSVPVATEIVGHSGFTAKVTYTGSVAPYTEQNVYPRVEGYLQDLKVYNGDRVAAGALLAVVDSPDLQTKVAEAAAGRIAATSEIAVAQAETAKMIADSAAMRGEIETAKSELAGAKARLAAMSRTVTSAQQEVRSAQANLDYWKTQIRRQENLLKEGAISRQEFDSENAQTITAEAEVANKKAALEEARANVQAMEAEVRSKQTMISVARQRASAAEAAVNSSRRQVAQKSAMARQASAMVSTAATIDDYRYIRAPFAGVVTKRYISPGQLVNPATAVINIVQMDKVRLQANVADADVGRIHVGAPVTARLPKHPEKAYYARVSSISPLADQSSRTATVEAIVENPGHKLNSGDFVTMEIAASTSTDGISVPHSALVQRDTGNAVWVVRSEGPKGKMTYFCTMHPEVVSDKPGDCPKCNMKLEPTTSSGNKKAHLVAVTTGSTNGSRMEIVSGLNDGDEVIYQGHTYLKEGDTVFPTKWGKDGPQELPKGSGGGEMQGMPGHGSHGASDGTHGTDEANGTNTAPALRDEKAVSKHTAFQHGAAAKGQKTYICPMCPGVVSHKAGDRCPKCGMNLEEKK